jgi:hypothetical protein
MKPDDPMWNEFRPLWKELVLAGDEVHLAGGYGLFLKQRWLLAHRDHAIVIPLEKWRDATPRVTNDLDIVVGLALLASAEAQRSIAQALERNDFKVVQEHPRWQFEKQLDSDRRVLVDLHAELPESDNPNLSLDKKMRVKHKPSLGDEGVHGRQNPQAAGCSLCPFLFQIHDITISVPNPVTWSVMKLISTRDRRLKSVDAERNEEHRTFHHYEAMKHARDVARIIAMTSRDERDRADEVIAKIREQAYFADAVATCDQLFVREDGWGAQVAGQHWRADEFNLIRDVLAGWFR